MGVAAASVADANVSRKDWSMVTGVSESFPLSLYCVDLERDVCFMIGRGEREEEDDGLDKVCLIFDLM